MYNINENRYLISIVKNSKVLFSKYKKIITYKLSYKLEIDKLY